MATSIQLRIAPSRFNWTHHFFSLGGSITNGCQWNREGVRLASLSWHCKCKHWPMAKVKLKEMVSVFLEHENVTMIWSPFFPSWSPHHRFLVFLTRTKERDALLRIVPPPRLNKDEKHWPLSRQRRRDWKTRFFSSSCPGSCSLWSSHEASTGRSCTVPAPVDNGFTSLRFEVLVFSLRFRASFEKLVKTSRFKEKSIANSSSLSNHIKVQTKNMQYANLQFQLSILKSKQKNPTLI